MSSDELSAFADVLQTLRSGETLLCVRGFTRLLLEKGGASKTHRKQKVLFSVGKD